MLRGRLTAMQREPSPPPTATVAPLAELPERLALARQTATTEVLATINANPGDLAPVFEAILDKAHALCGADLGALFLLEGEEMRAVATQGYPPGTAASLMARRSSSGRSHRLRAGERLVHTPDLAEAPAPGSMDALVAGFGVRTSLMVPLREGGRLLGWITANRLEVKPYTEAEIGLLESFAAQAVIAIQNARLLGELRERTAELAERNEAFAERIDHQAATIDVLKAMSASPGDPQPVFELIAERARQVCNAPSAGLSVLQDGLVHLRTVNGVGAITLPGRFEAFRTLFPMPPNERSLVCRAVLRGEIVHCHDVGAEPGLFPEVYAVGHGSSLTVPMLREGHAIGAVSLSSMAKGGFSDSQVALLQTFAEQAVIAITSAETYRALQERTAELSRSVAAAEAALAELRTAQDRLVQTEKLASLGQLTAGIAHEIKNPLNFVNNFADLSAELVQELAAALAPAGLEPALREEVGEAMALLRSNLEKVSHHGRRADSIVRNMLAHSREGGGERRRVALNPLVEDALNLAYHGARAERPGFTIALDRALDPAVGEVVLYPQEFTRVLLNLIGNGFDAAQQKTRQGAPPGFVPRLGVATRALPGAVEVRVRDNGTGIPDAVRARIFEPFFTTKPAGEGTGLGLSLSHDIVVKQHGGRLDLVTEPGEFTEFVVTLPQDEAGR
jgi:signal transduction histidine kinase